ncbi:MAG: hypothetical protein KAW12_03310 [Candidatus Aminicenantes bacterium]|nr:hypothetical protein [Candidatus Aminicenantes bacterium]
MALVNALQFNYREEEYEAPRAEGDLEKVAREYVEKHGGKSLGHIDTPAFIRKNSNITLMPAQELRRQRKVLEPDKKILDLIAVLRGDNRAGELSLSF